MDNYNPGPNAAPQAGNNDPNVTRYFPPGEGSVPQQDPAGRVEAPRQAFTPPAAPQQAPQQTYPGQQQYAGPQPAQPPTPASSTRASRSRTSSNIPTSTRRGSLCLCTAFNRVATRRP